MIQQTAVEWLMNELDTRGGPDGCSLTWKDLDNLIELARRMEKEQIIEAFDCDGTPQPGEKWISNGEQYYNETYGK